MVRKPSPDRRAEFLRSALKLFAANGEQNTSTAAIARAAGTAAGTLFLYFPTKQDLVRELILQIGREQSDHIKSLLAPTLSVRETFLTIWVGSIHWFLENMDAYHYYRQVRDSGLVEAAVVQESNQYFSYYYDAIQKGLAQGRIKPYPIEMIGGILYQDINAVMGLIDAQADPAKREEYIRSGFEIFWGGIKTGDD
jgi:AcrR family transcriptional regulator